MWQRSVKLACLIFVVALTFFAGANAYAQGGATSSLTGTVVDSSGGVVPGADVVVKNNATGAVFTAVSNVEGAFTIPTLSPGTYTVTISLQGFKTLVLNDVVVNAGVSAQVRKATLELGKVEETIVVTGATEILQTQSSAVANTISAKQLSSLPLPGRGAFDFVSLTPGVAAASGSTRYSSVNGLPQGLVNITLDGMNIQDNYLKTTDGMFTRVSPRLDAVEEVTIGTAAQGADMSGQGGIQVRMVTRSGSNKFIGSAYYYFQRDWMNTNTWFNLHHDFNPKPVVALYQPGFRFGGPVVIPHLFDGHDKLFFFVNYEVANSPGTSSLTRTIMSPNSQQGLFQYTGGPPVDLMALAAKNGQTSTIDPTVATVLSAIRASTATTGTLYDTIGDPLTQTYIWQFPTKGLTKYPTVRLDYNLTSKHGVSFSYTQNHLVSDPDTLNGYYRYFPGFPTNGMQNSYRYTGQGSLRSMLTKSMVNEVRMGATGGATYFFPELNAGMFTGQTPDFHGYGIGLTAFRGISNPYNTSANSSREASTRVVEDRLSWQKRSHSLSFGASFTQADVWLANQQYVPTLTMGIATGDPADAMFTTTNFPGASSNDLTNARNLYAVLTGRISAITRNARVAEDGSTYVILGPSKQLGRLRQLGFFVQDSWRWKPNLTVNAGLRYDVQFPFYALNNSYSTATLNDIFGITGVGNGFVAGSTETGLGNLFKPGTLQGTATTYQMLTKNNYAYNTDTNNLAPSIGAAWTTGAQSGFLRKILGQKGDTVFRTGFNIAYQRGGMSDFTGVFGSNPGISIDASRNQTNGNLGTVPVLLRSSDLGPPGISLTRSYPMGVPNASSSVYTFDSNIQVPFSTSFTVGMQRALTKTMVVEARFIHTGSTGAWRSFNYNETNIVENGFLNEFKIAQTNLVANIAAGKGNTFAYTGATGTNPLPIFLAFFNGLGSGSAGDTTKYTGSGWTTSSYLTNLFALNPNPQSLAGSLRTNATYSANAITAGLPANFFVVNPAVSGAYLTANGLDTRYNGLQLVLTRRFSHGLQATANYSLGRGYQFNYYSFRKPAVEIEQNYNNATTNATGDVRHAFAATWVYELPFGQGKKFGGNVNRYMDMLIGSWAFMGIARVQTGRLVDLGNVNLVGMTKADVQKMFKLRMTTDPNNGARTLIYDWPQDVIDNTIKAYSFNASGYTQGDPTGRYFKPANGPSCIEVASGYGDCGVRSLIVSGPPIIRFDMSITKQIKPTGRLGFEFQAQVFNVFNRANFNPVSGISSSTLSGYEVTGAVDQSRTMQLALRINWQ
jgi:hypothetical protein